MKLTKTVTSMALTILMATAQAHHVWIEQDDQQARLYFGELNMNLREASPGLLDKFSAPTAILIGSKGQQQLLLNKGTQAFVIHGHAAHGESIVAEETHYSLYDKQVEGKTVKAWYRPAARYLTDFNYQPPLLTLDVVPTGKPGELKVFYQGSPLAKAEVTVIAESGWVHEMKSDAQGLFTVSLPWKSTYGIEVHHTDATPGTRGSETYAVTSYVTTVSLLMSKGLPAPPAPALAVPNKTIE